MPTKILVPQLGESVVEATVGRWRKQAGDAVAIGDVLVELETEKVNLEVGAEQAGVLAQIARNTGDDVKIGDVLGVIEEGATATAAAPKPEADATPVAKKMAEVEGVNLAQVSGTGPGQKVTKQDVKNFLEQQIAPPAPAAKASPPPAPMVAAPGMPAAAPVAEATRREERVKLSRRRRTIARRLVEAQHNAAMLTTFNEVDLGAVMDIRKRRKDSFKEKHNVGLGFMSFFVKASVGALKAFPLINAEIQDDEVLLKHYYDIGIAVGAEEGLVVPVLRDADRLSFAEIERRIKAYADKARAGSLSLDDLRGGTFTITNGGVFGSLLSTPILNAPQVGILGMHKIQERPMAVGGQVVIRPIMYVALSYDHRIVDGREAVQFLVKIKELLEDPETLLLEG